MMQVKHTGIKLSFLPQIPSPEWGNKFTTCRWWPRKLDMETLQDQSMIFIFHLLNSRNEPKILIKASLRTVFLYNKSLLKKWVLKNQPPTAFIFQANVIKGSASLAYICEFLFFEVFQFHIKYKVRDDSQCHGHYARTQLCQSIWTHARTCWASSKDI